MAKGEPRTRLQRQLEGIFQQHQDVALSLSLARSRTTARRLIATANEEEVPSPRATAWRECLLHYRSSVVRPCTLCVCVCVCDVWCLLWLQQVIFPLFKYSYILYLAIYSQHIFPLTSHSPPHFSLVSWPRCSSPCPSAAAKKDAAASQRVCHIKIALSNHQGNSFRNREISVIFLYLPLKELEDD